MLHKQLKKGLSKGCFFIGVVLSVLLFIPNVVRSQSEPPQKHKTLTKKQQEKQAIKAEKQAKKEEKKLRKAYRKRQSKSTRKSMNRNKRKSDRQRKEKKPPFWERWFRRG